MPLILLVAACQPAEPTGDPAAEYRDAVLIAWEGPPDPVLMGNCALIVDLRDAETGDPVASKAWLWKLDVGGNEDWAQGDQLIGPVDLPGEVSDLSEGRYRFAVDGERRGATAGPAFEVSGPSTSIRVEVLRPRISPVEARVVSESGSSAGWVVTGRSELVDQHWDRTREPIRPWVTIRQGIGPLCWELPRCEPPAPRPLVVESWRRQPDGDDVFHLGEIEGSTWVTDLERAFRFAQSFEPDAPHVDLVIHGSTRSKHSYYVVIPGEEAMQAVLDAAVIPEGGPPIDPRDIQLLPGYGLGDQLPEDEPWRHVRLRAIVEHPAYRRLWLDFSLESPPEPRELVPIE